MLRIFSEASSVWLHTFERIRFQSRVAEGGSLGTLAGLQVCWSSETLCVPCLVLRRRGPVLASLERAREWQEKGLMGNE